MTEVRAHSGWQEDNVRVQDARRPFGQRLRAALQVDGAPLVTATPSERRMAAGIEAQSYYTYPLLFYPIFPEINLDQLNSLSLCGSYLFDFVLCLDKLLDRSPQGDAGSLLLATRCQREALALLQPLFPADHAFWRYYDQFDAHFSQALLQERARHHCLVTPYEPAALEFIYSGKPAIAKAALAALGLLVEREDLIAPLCASHDAFYVAFQLLDDLLDWRLDYPNRHYSYPLTWAFERAGIVARVEGEPRPTLGEVAQVLAQVDVVGHVRSLALGYLARAEAPLAGLPDSAWGAAILKIRGDVERLGASVPKPASAPTQLPAPRPWPETEAALALPLSRRFAPWLDSRRRPAPAAPQLAGIQREVLRAVGGARTFGEALVQVGLAIEASRRRAPGCAPGAHLGLAPAEFEWCREHDAWLQGLLTVSLADEPWLWTPDDDVPQAARGFMPLGLGRYLGQRLVQDYPGAIGADCGDEALWTAVLQHFQRQVAA